MVSVAKNFDAPIKLLFPKQYPPQEKQFSMLGLGFDAREKLGTNVFEYCLGGYVLGLGTTVFVMHVFEAAQPALLYIVPACIATSMAGAAVKGKFSELWNYSEGEEEADGEAKAKDEKAPAESKKDS